MLPRAVLLQPGRAQVTPYLLGDGVGGHVPPAQRVRGPGAAHGHLVLPVVQEAALLRRGLFTKAGQPLVTSTNPSALSHNNPASAAHNARPAQHPTSTAPRWDSLQAGELERVGAETMRIMNDEGEEKIRLTGLVAFRATNFGKVPMFKQSAVSSGVRTFSLLIPAAQTFAAGMCHQGKGDVCVFCSKHPLLAVLRWCWLRVQLPEPPGLCQGRFLYNFNLEFNVCLNMNGHNTQGEFPKCS